MKKVHDRIKDMRGNLITVEGEGVIVSATTEHVYLGRLRWLSLCTNVYGEASVKCTRLAKMHKKPSH